MNPTTERPRCRFLTATTLDGFLADEHDSLDWLFTQEHDPEGPGSADTYLASVGVLVMGATTYTWVVDHLAASGDAWPYEQPCFVFTHRELDPVTDQVRLVSGAPADVWPQIAEAAGDREVWMVGGGALAADFAHAGLLDEVDVSIAPVMLGSGRPLFTRSVDLRLVELARNGAFVHARYAVVGPR
ncbi:dihydrofolate reductase family protein [Aeromicrobium sp. CF4.19]|uniref:dihydrofolate reductase family protein n=1 Tax=Aeromicrobium sp. CF4.19 TaxID=3373082 RepID=UPI003EE5B216